MTKNKQIHPLANLPVLDFSEQSIDTTNADASIAGKISIDKIPTDDECFALWDRYQVLDNVRTHSLGVANFATELARFAVEKGEKLCVHSVRASALLHDIAKSYTIAHGGSHAQTGASWVIEVFGNRQIAQGVAMHVHWPFDLPKNICQLPFIIIYADKRIMHDTCVTLEERYEDLLLRYGTTKEHKKNIKASYEQGVAIEHALSAQLELEFHAYTFNSGRLVKRA